MYVKNKYFVSLFVLISLGIKLMNAQSTPTESLLEFESFAAQKVIRISDRLKDKWGLSNSFIQLFYYNMEKDSRWPADQIPYKVFVTTGFENNMILELKDNGKHFDNKTNDGVFANYHVGDINNFRTDETNIDVCCYYDNITGDSIGISYSLLHSPVRFIPGVSKFLEPLFNTTISEIVLYVQWINDKNSNGSGLILLNKLPTFGELLKNILWEKTYKTDINTVDDQLPIKLEDKKEYHLLVWSYVDAINSTPSESMSSSYSLEWVSFNVDTSKEKNQLSVIQNYPNPFISSTIFTWIQKERGFITLSIFNILGEEIKTLIQQTLPAGEHFLSWDGTDRHGKKVSSGIYLVRFIISNQIKTLKVILN